MAAAGQRCSSSTGILSSSMPPFPADQAARPLPVGTRARMHRPGSGGTADPHPEPLAGRAALAAQSHPGALVASGALTRARRMLRAPAGRARAARAGSKWRRAQKTKVVAQCAPVHSKPAAAAHSVTNPARVARLSMLGAGQAVLPRRSRSSSRTAFEHPNANAPTLPHPPVIHRFARVPRSAAHAVSHPTVPAAFKSAWAAFRSGRTRVNGRKSKVISSSASPACTTSEM